MIRRQRRLVRLTVGTLLVVGVAAIGLRHQYGQSSILGDGDGVWRLDVTVTAESTASGPDQSVRVALPTDTESARVFEQRLTFPGVSGRVVRGRESGEQVLVLRDFDEWTAQALVEVQIHVRADGTWRVPERTPTAAQLGAYLKLEPRRQYRSPELTETLRQLRRGIDDKVDLLQAIFDHCAGRLVLVEGASEDPVEVLATGRGSIAGGARAMVGLCRSAKIPARVVWGLDLATADFGSEVMPRPWVEAFQGGRWLAFDPENGYAGTVPGTYLPLRFGDVPVVQTTGAVEVATSYVVRRGRVPTGLIPERQGWSAIFDLKRLPVSVQHSLALLLILPFGGLMTAVLRNLVGVRTFGTFAPALFALAFVYADWKTGVALLAAVTVAGGLGRHFLEQLKVLLVARLGVLMTGVVLCGVMTVSAIDYFGIAPSTEAVTLPIVIMAMLIERAYVTGEEDGLGTVVQMAAGSVLVATCCLLMMHWDGLGRLVLAYPEMHLLTLAGMIAVGRYSGYRLTELRRFRDLSVAMGLDKRS